MNGMLEIDSCIYTRLKKFNVINVSTIYFQI